MIYLDYAATTPLNEDVKNTYFQLLNQYFYNSDSIYNKGIEVNRLLEQARDIIADYLHVKNSEIIFTSCGSEANNMAIKGCAFQYANRGKHIITTCIEHSSVYEACKELENVFGFDVTYLPVDHYGYISLDDLKEAIREDTILVTTMYVNNELGSMNPVHLIGDFLSQYPTIIYHVDMVQALGKLDIDLSNIDLASFSAHKINGLKGSGLLYKSQHITLVPLINGGQQEFGLRGGTSNACTNIVLAKTLRLALENREEKYHHVNKLNHYLREKLLSIDGIVINSGEDALPHILNFSCLGYKPEVILHDLEAKEIYISTRSACSSKTNQISRIMAQLHIDDKIASSALRVSLGHLTSFQDIDKFVYCLEETMNNIKKAG